MAKRKITKTQRERALVQQQVRRMESRGYRIDDSVKQKIKSGNYQALHALRKNKYAKLYNQSSSEIDGKIAGGSEKRRYERRQSALKSAETVRKRREQEEWERRRRRQDSIDARRAYDIEQGEIMYKNITDIVDKFPMRKGTNVLSRGLQSEINKYGKDKVMAGMANAPINIVQLAQEIAFYSDGADGLHDAIVAFFDSITGAIMSAEEAQDIGDYMDEITDMSEP